MVEDGTSHSRWLLLYGEHREQIIVRLSIMGGNAINLSTPQSKSVMVEYGVGARFIASLSFIFLSFFAFG